MCLLLLSQEKATLNLTWRTLISAITAFVPPSDSKGSMSRALLEYRTEIVEPFWMSQWPVDQQTLFTFNELLFPHCVLTTDNGLLCYTVKYFAGTYKWPTTEHSTVEQEQKGQTSGPGGWGSKMVRKWRSMVPTFILFKKQKKTKRETYCLLDKQPHYGWTCSWFIQ